MSSHTTQVPLRADTKTLKATADKTRGCCQVKRALSARARAGSPEGRRRRALPPPCNVPQPVKATAAVASASAGAATAQRDVCRLE